MNSLKKLRDSFDELSVDALLVYDELNVRYLCGFSFTDGLLLITKNRALLLTDFRYLEMAQKNAYSDFEVFASPDRVNIILSALKDEGVKSIGFEGRAVSYARYHALTETYNDYKLVDIGGVIESLREIKTEEELSYMAKAQEITDKAFSELLGVLTPNMTEIEVAAELEYRMRRLGSEGVAFDTIAVSGPSSALPHGTPSSDKLKPGFLTMDFGASYNGYLSDMTRTVVIGKADEDIKRVYNTVLSAQMAALDFIRAGVVCADADKVARDIIDAAYPNTFGHSLGHSVGLFVHEEPRLAAKVTDRILRVNEVVTVEPGIYLYGKYGCRIEDMVAIEKDGVRNFTKSTKDLIEIF